MKGKFIVLEGIDGSGTTTQIELLAEELENRGMKVYTTFEPTDSPIGELLNQILRGETDVEWDEKTLMLLYSADRNLHMKYMQKLLEEGYWVICDRYKYSSYAYQGDALEWDDFKLMEDINESFPKPDHAFLLDTPVDVCLERINSRGESLEMYERREKLSSIREKYIRYKGTMKVIDGNRNRYEIREELLSYIL